MEINNLLTQIKKTSSNTHKYLAIEIGRETVKTAVWEVVGTRPNLIATGSIEEYTLSDPHEFVATVDTSLSKALENIDPEPDQVIFSLPESWVTGSSIQVDKKPLLQTLTKKLGMQPIGFVVTTEAIIQYLKTKQGGPFTGILIGVNDQDLQVTLVKNGSIIESHTVGRSDDLGADVEEGIARFKDLDSLPANMIVFDGHTNLDSHKQELISYEWQDRLPFLHIPKIDTFSPDETITAVVQAAGAEVIKALETTSPDSSTNPDPPLSPKSTSTDVPDESQTSTQDIPDLSEEFGFTDHLKAGDNFSTVADTPDDSEPTKEASLSQDEELDDDLEPEVPSPGRFSVFRLPRFPLPSLSSLSSLHHLSRIKNTSVVGAILLFLTISGSIAAGFAYWYFPTADVTLFLSPRIIDTQLEFTIDSNLDQVDLDTATIPGRIVSATATSTVQTAATGSLLIGESASGRVTIYNRTLQNQTLPAATKLIGPDSLTYSINDTVTIASASSKENPDFSITTEPATADVSITAVNIGAQYNLGSGTEFSLANYSKSQFIAKATSDIAGGSSRQVTAVSPDDVTNLTSQALEELKQQIQSQYSTTDTVIGAVFLTPDDLDLSQDFSADVGDEATSISLTSSAATQVMTYNLSDINHLIEQQVVASAPENYQFVKSQSELDIISSEPESDDTVVISAKAKSKVIPALDPTIIISDIHGRFPSVTQDYFQSLPNFTRVEIDIQPRWLPSFIKTFPRVESKINLHITTD